MVNITFDVPAEMLQLAQNPDTKNRPYDLCLYCPFQSNTCDGPNCLAMHYERWVQWVNSIAKRKGLTRLMIAERANRPVSTINTVLSGDAKDVKAATMADITRAVLGGSWGQYPCHFASLLLTHNIGDLNADQNAAEIRHQMDLQAEDSQKKISFMREEIAARDRRIEKLDAQLADRDASIHSYWRVVTLLVIALVLTLAIIILALTVDRINPDVGFFWRSAQTVFSPTATGYFTPI